MTFLKFKTKFDSNLNLIHSAFILNFYEIITRPKQSTVYQNVYILNSYQICIYKIKHMVPKEILYLDK